MIMKKPFRTTTLAAAICASLFIASPAWAVGETVGSVNGNIATTQQQEIGDAEIKLVNKANGLTRVVQSDERGHFRVTQLPIGDYEMTVSKVGFASSKPVSVVVRVGAGTSVVVELQDESAEHIEVMGARVAGFDMESTDSGLTLSENMFDRLPNMRDANKIALLAPGVSEADAGFGGLPVFSGASAAENVYYINGLNITDFRRGLGGADVPFEFFQEFQVKTGGYSAAFGRSTGGVVNAVSKSGSNEWQGSANVYWSPDSLQKKSRDVYNRSGTLISSTSHDTSDDREINIEVGGPLIQDKLFVYALVNPRKVESEDYGDGSYFKSTNSDMFWGAKVDYLINDKHRVEYTAFSNHYTKDWVERDWDETSNTIGGKVIPSDSERGGINQILKYSAILGDTFTASVTVGRTENELTDTSDLDINPAIYYSTDGSNYTSLGYFANSTVGTANDQRDVQRLDFNWDIGSHSLAFGIDHEKMTSEEYSQHSGGVIYYIDDYNADDPGETSELWIIHRRNYGSFETESNAMYLEATWRFDEVTFTTGLRNDMFENRNGLGGAFIKMRNTSLSGDDLLLRDSDNQWAPRYGMVWNIGGDDDDKLFATAGRYFLPVANILNIKLAGAYYKDRQILEYVGRDADTDLPYLTGDEISSFRVQFDGETDDPRTIVNQDIKPMYQDEFIIGYERRLNDQWTGQISFIYRDLKRAIEDSVPCKALDDIAEQRYGYGQGEDGFCWSLSTIPYVLTNPGEDMRFWYDFGEGDGLEELTLSADQLGFPKAKRTYKGVDFVFDRAFDGYWDLNISYTWSKTEGNYEGTVNSDGAGVQRDAGFTESYDFYSLLDYANGDLSNDRRHKLKIRGSVVFAENWEAGFNWFSLSGRPRNFLGVHPDDVNNDYWVGARNFYEHGAAAPRGSKGRTSWVHGLDLSLQYNFELAAHDANVRLDVGNVFNFDHETGTYDVGELDNGDDDPNYGAKWELQSPRSITLSASFEF